MSSDTATDDLAAAGTGPADAAPEPDETATAVASSDDTAQDDAEPEAEADDESNPNAEAAKYRHKLRDEKTAHQETRAALEAATARVEALQRQQIENLISGSHVKPAAVWAVTELADMVGEDGTVSVEAVNTAIDTARKTLGIQPIGKGAYVPAMGSRPDGTPKTDGWADAFKPKRGK